MLRDEVLSPSYAIGVLGEIEAGVDVSRQDKAYAATWALDQISQGGPGILRRAAYEILRGFSGQNRRNRLPN